MSREGDENTCDICPAFAPWSVMDHHPDDVNRLVTRWFACGRHLHRVLLDADWEVDQVVVMHVDKTEEWS